MGKENTIQYISNIWVNNFHPLEKLPFSKKSIKTLISSIFATEETPNIEIIINFISDRAIKKINKNYLGHNYVSDVITFPYNVNKKRIDGELFIALDRVKNNALTYRTKYPLELKRVIIHGCLHLLGYDDKNKKLTVKMREKENFYLYN